MDAWWLEPRGVTALSLACGGDCGLIGRLRAVGRRATYDAVLAAAAARFRAADLATINLESPVSRVAPGHEFYHDPEVIPALLRAGVRLVSLANNHMLDLGPQGLETTLAVCREAGMATVGAGRDAEEAHRPVVLEARGQRVGFLAYCAPHAGSATVARPGVAAFDAERLRADLRALRPGVDWLVVHAHWGSMYVDDPPPRVLDSAALLAEEGADLVVGHHPHVLQGIERRGRAVVAYSLGDLVFDPTAGDFVAELGREKRRQTVVATAALAPEAHGLRLDPLVQGDDFVPRAASATEAATIRERLRVMSAGLATARARFARDSGAELMRYEVQSLLHYAKRGRLAKIAQLLLSVRPRHLPIFWSLLRRARAGKPAGRA